MLGRLTAEEYERIPSDHTELVDGRVVSMTPTNYEDGRLTVRLAVLFSEYAERTGWGEFVSGEAGFVTRRRPDRVRARTLPG